MHRLFIYINNKHNKTLNGLMQGLYIVYADKHGHMPKYSNALCGAFSEHNYYLNDKLIVSELYIIGNCQKTLSGIWQTTIPSSMKTFFKKIEPYKYSK